VILQLPGQATVSQPMAVKKVILEIKALRKMRGPFEKFVN
jgi:hypothetical protein